MRKPPTEIRHDLYAVDSHSAAWLPSIDSFCSTRESQGIISSMSGNYLLSAHRSPQANIPLIKPPTLELEYVPWSRS